MTADNPNLRIPPPPPPPNQDIKTNDPGPDGGHSVLAGVMLGALVIVFVILLLGKG